MTDFQPNQEHLAHWLQRQAALRPQAVAIQTSLAQSPIVGRQSWTYAALWQEVLALASRMQAQGVGRGDKVGLLLYNDPIFVVAYFALLGLGVTVIPLNIRLKPDELALILQDAEATGLVVDPELLGASQHLDVPTLTWVLLNGQSLIYASKCPSNSEEQPTQWLGCPAQVWLPQPEGCEPQAELALPGFCEEVDTNPEAFPAVLIYTSGTTGLPKGVMLTHRSLGSDAIANAMVIQANEDDVFVTISPLFHVFGQVNIMLTAIRAGGTMTLLRKFSPRAVLETIERHRVTFMAAVPTMYLMMLTHLESSSTPGFELTSLRVCHSGAAPMAREVLRRVEAAFGARVQEGYGLSEASSIVTSNPYEGTRKPGSVGLPLPGFVLQVADENGQPCPSGEVGEIWVKAPMVMAGYYKRPDLTAMAFSAEGGWLRTKDMAYLDEEGYVFIVDRKDDLMNIGGVKVYPREVEEVLFQHPAVQAVAVVGVQSALYHEEIKAYVVFKDRSQVSIPSWGDLKRFCREHLAEYKIPKQWQQVAEIPQGATGKVLRKDLRGAPAAAVIS